MTGRRRWKRGVALVAGLLAIELAASAYGFLGVPFHDYLLDPRTHRADWMRAIRARDGYELHLDTGIRMAANRRGFRGPDFEAGTPDRPVVVCLGNGSVHGDAVLDGETWPARLEGELAEVVTPAPAVLNLGLPGAGIHLGNAILVEDALPLRPRVVVVAFAGLNEALRALATEREYLAHPRPVLRSSGTFLLLERWGYALRNRRRGEPRVLRVALDEYRSELEQAIARIRTADAVPVLLGEHHVHPGIPGFFADEEFAAYGEVQRAVARATGVALVEPAAVLAGWPDGRAFQENRILYTAEANAALARALARLPVWAEALAAPPGRSATGA